MLVLAVVACRPHRLRPAGSSATPPNIIVAGVTSGKGIDYARAAPQSCSSSSLLYVVRVRRSPTCSRYLLAGVVQRTMRRLRAEVEDKLNRLPLGYVDRQPRGDLLSRVTNDIDNIAQSLQQTLSQMLTRCSRSSACSS